MLLHQFLSRYKSWTESNLPALELPSNVTAAIAAEKGTPAATALTSRSATPLPPAADGTDTSAADEIALQRLANALIDLTSMESRVWDLWSSEIGILLPDGSNDDDATSQEGTPLFDIYSFHVQRLTHLDRCTQAVHRRVHSSTADPVFADHPHSHSPLL